MREALIKKLSEYIRENNPDLLIRLREDGKEKEYLSDKLNTINALIDQEEKELPGYILEQKCMDILTEDLRPSRFNYISLLLEEEFGTKYQQFQEAGILKFVPAAK